MRTAIRWFLLLLLLVVLCAECPVVSAKAPVLPIPTPRQSILSPKSGVPKMSLPTPNGKAGAKKKSWFPFGNRNKKVVAR